MPALFFAAVSIAQLAALALGIFGVGGLIFTALRYNRDDTTAIVNQQNAIVSEMKTLNDELRVTIVDLRAERDSLKVRVAYLEGRVADGD